MGGEVVTAEGTWLDVAKAAADAERQEFLVDEHSNYPDIVNPLWITLVNDAKVKKDSKFSCTGGEDGRLGIAPLLRRELAAQSSESFLTPLDVKEQALVKKLNECLERPKALSKRTFLDLLGEYLIQRTLSPGTVTSVPPDAKANGAVSETNEESATLGLLEKCAEFLGRRLVSIILDCSISLRFWAVVEVLLECRVVRSNFCPRLVQSLVEGEQARALCLYVRFVPDLRPQDVYMILTFFLDSIDKPPKSFQVVKREWKKVALVAMKRASEGRIRTEVDSADALFYDSGRLAQGINNRTSAAIGVAMAVDGFSSPEMCLHCLLSSGQDEAVISSVISQLSTQQLLKLVKYLGRWIERYSSRLANFPNPKYRKIPSLALVLSWAGVVLEGNFAKFVLFADFHKELGSMRDLVQSLVAMGTSLSPLGGITEHLRFQLLLPGGIQRGGASSDYVIELMDMS